MIVCGIDEAGRGPLAGPVTAGAVVLGPDFPVEVLADSKALSEKKRMRAVKIIMEKAYFWGTGWAWPEEIDMINIHHAALLAMKRAFFAAFTADSDRKNSLPDLVIVDGLFIPDIPCPARAEVKADSRIPEVQAASILAKTARDRWMVRYSWIEPRYRYEKHKGYPTEEHRNLIREFGDSRIQRKSFRTFPPASDCIHRQASFP